jgi:lambda family phage tail tape measure protein
MTTRDYLFRLRGESDQLTKSADSAAASVERLADNTEHVARAQAAAKTSGDAFAAGMARSATQFGTFARTGKLGAQELQQVGFQLNDLAVQVASGQNPLTALVQQGSQLSGTFGGIRPALAALGTLITPAVVGIGALAAGVVALGVAYSQGQDEGRAFNDSLVLTGNYAGVTAGQVDGMARSIAALNARPIGDVREALAAVVGSGKFGPQNIEAVTTAVVTLQKFTGQAADDIVKQFAGMSSGVAKWAAEQNKAYNFLTPQVYAQIRALEAQGKTQDAIALTVGALNDKFEGQTRNLGYLGTAYDTAKKAASGFWDFVKGIGRDTTVEERIAQITAALEAPLSPEENNSGGGYQAALRAQLEALQESKRAQDDKAAKDAQSAEANQKAIEEQSVAHQGALASIERAGSAQRLAQAEAVKERGLATLRDQWAKELVTVEGYVSQRVAIESNLINAKERALNEEIALERRRPVDSKTDTLAQQAKLIDLETRRIGIARERASLAERAASGELKPPKREENRFAALEGAIQDDLERRLQQNSDQAQLRREKDAETALRYAQDLKDANRDLSDSLITDDRARGEAIIAAEEAQILKRIDLAVLSAKERKAIEDDVATYIALRNQQLTEELKPEWQRQLEAWQDVTQLMADEHDRFITGFLQTGEEAWSQFLATGKLSLDNFGKLVLDELARLTYRQGIAPAVAGIGNAIFGALSSAFGFAKGGVFDGGGQVAQRFASGGAFTNQIVTQPTPFRFARGGAMANGLMGEAGPEGIMPLARTASGKLGVAAVGGGQGAPVVNNFTFENAPPVESRSARPNSSGGEDVLVRFARQIKDDITADMAGGGSMARATAGRFGLNNGATLRRRGG